MTAFWQFSRRAGKPESNGTNPMSFKWQTVPLLIAVILTVEGCASHRKAQHTNWTVRAYGSAADEVEKAEAWVCEAFRPIAFSEQDAMETRAQISEHNAVWDALCPEDME